MAGLILSRLLQVFPSLIIISWILFFLGKCTPSDPLEKLTTQSLSGDQVLQTDLYQSKYNQLAKSIGYDLPLFYFSVVPRSYPDDLEQMEKFERETFLHLLRQHPDVQFVRNYLNGLESFREELITAGKDWPATQRVRIFRQVKQFENHLDIDDNQRMIEALSASYPELGKSESLASLSQILRGARKVKADFRPRFIWHGFHNQYHRWMVRLFQFDFGYSLRDGRPATSKIKEALKWTLLLNGLVLILAFVFSIILGTYQAALASPFWDRVISSLTYVFFAIPLFWLATLAVVFLTTNEYGAWTNIFPGVGVLNSYSGSSFISRFFQSVPRLILPALCMILSMIAFLTRQMRSSVRGEMDKSYVQLLKTKGMARNKRVWRHIMPNALFPMITLFGSLIPFMFAGSLVIEYIFNIPGMGYLLMDSILFEDWNVVFTIVFLIALVTMVGLLVADILYHKIDPRISA